MSKRPIIVLTATVAGLVGVLTFHTSPVPTSLGPLSKGTTVRGASSASTGAGAGPAKGGGSTPTTATTAPSNGTRSATGPGVDYTYGVISVEVTVKGHSITNVSIASLQDGGSFRSESIDQQSIPILEQEVMQAQSADIQSVSGASYTSAGFEQSLQSALSNLGI